MILAVVICVVAIVVEPVVYQLALLPLIQGGRQVSTPIWLLLWGAIPAAAFATGLLVIESRRSAAIVTAAAVLRRLTTAAMAAAGAPGLKKLDVNDWEYWTWMLAVEVFAWLLFAWVGRRLRLASLGDPGAR
jgi:hypothetical protein